MKRAARSAALPALAWLVAVIIVAAVGPWLAADPDAIDLGARLLPPTVAHALGTDHLGRDVLARMVAGARVSLLVGFAATLIAIACGMVLGALAGYYGGIIDWLVSRSIETVVCFPFLFLLLAVVALFRPSVITLVIAIGLTSWTTTARLVRGEILRLRAMDFAHAARAIGARDGRIIVIHLLPNALATVLVPAAFGVGSTILVESALSFLGLGVPLPAASWGSILATADDYTRAWWLAVFPGTAIFLTVAACNILGEFLRDRLDPTWVDGRRI